MKKLLTMVAMFVFLLIGGVGQTLAYDNDTCNPTYQVPEPSSLLMIGAGLIGMAVALKRSKK